MAILATHDSFLKSDAQLLILPTSSDGVILHNVIAKIMTLYPSNLTKYQSIAKTGELKLGDVVVHTVQKQATGLAVGTNKSADYIANLITTHHAHHQTQKSTLITALKNLNPKLYQLMRYQGLKTAAFYAPPISPHAINAELLYQTIQQTLHLPRLRLSVHFDKHVGLEWRIQSLSTQIDTTDQTID